MYIFFSKLSLYNSFSQPEHSVFSMQYFVVLVLLRLLVLCIMLIEISLDGGSVNDSVEMED
jgi:hypothetical protein